MARHAQNPTRPGLLRRLWPFTCRRASTLDRLGPAASYPKRAAAYRAIGVAKVSYLPERPSLTLSGWYRAGRWS